MIRTTRRAGDRARTTEPGPWKVAGWIAAGAYAVILVLVVVVGFWATGYAKGLGFEG